LLETLTNLDQIGLKQATKATLDLAASQNIDLQSAALMVGRAIEGNTTSMQRMGISFEAGATKAETLANLLDALSSRSGAAEAQTNTYEGAVMALRKAHENLQIELGKVFTENQAVIDVFKVMAGQTNENTKTIDQMQRSLKLLVADGIYYAAGALEVLSKAADVVWRVFKVNFEMMVIPVDMLAAAIVAAGMAMKGDFAGALELMKTSGQKAFKDVYDAATSNTGLTGVSNKFDELRQAAAKGWSEIKSGAEVAHQTFTNGQPPAEKFAETLSKMAEAGKKLAESLLKVDPSKAYKEHEKMLKLHLDQEEITLAQYHAQQTQDLDKMYSDQLADLQAYYEESKMSDADYAAAKAALEQNSADDHALLRKKQSDEDQKDLETKLGYSSQFFGNLGSLSKTKNAELFEIGKQASAAQAVVDGFAAVQKTLASVPYPFSIPLAAAAGVAAAVNVANIEATHLATGIDSVPGIGSQDNFPAVLAPGERVVPAQTNQDLSNFLAGAQNQGPLLSAILSQLKAMTNFLAQGQTIEIDGQKVFAVIRNQLRGGRAFA
jgi:hypothetical protein